MRLADRGLPAAVAVCVLILVGCTSDPQSHAARGTRATRPSPTPGRSPTTSAPDIGPGITAVQVVSPASAVAVGQGRIWRTDDAGLTWHVQWNGVLALRATQALSSKVAFAVGSGRLLSTVDGSTWRLLPHTPLGAIDSVHFVTPDVGVARIGSLVGRTIDGGRHWARLATPAEPVEITACDARRLWLGTENAVWFSRDAGATWRRRLVVQNALLVGSAVPNDEVALQPTDACHVWARFSPGQGAASQSPWSLHVGGPDSAFQSPPGGLASDYPPAFSVIDPSTVALVGDSPAANPGSPSAFALFRGSVALTAANVPVFEPLCASFLNARFGYVVGSSEDGKSMLVLATRDGGRHWRTSLAQNRM